MKGVERVGTMKRPTRGARRAGERRRPTVWPWVAGIAAMVALGAVYFGAIGPYGSEAPAPTARTAFEPPADARITLLVGKPAPDFTLPRVEGGVFRLSEHRGKTSILLFFQEGIMCPPCWQQMRDLKRDGDRLTALNVALVTIAVDPAEELRQNAEREQVGGMLLLHDRDARLSKEYQATYVSMHPGERPGHTFILVDLEGKIAWRRDFREMHVPDAVILDAVAKALGR